MQNSATLTVRDVPLSGRPALDLKVQAALVGLLTLALYLALPERVYFFDGISFAGGVELVLENPDESGVLDRFPKHYLYIPSVYGLAWLLSGFVSAEAIDAYRLMQILAGCLAGCLNAILYMFLRRRIASVWTCLGLIAIWGFSNIHWERALEGQSYFAGQFWAILALLTFAAGDRTSRRTVWLTAICTALGGLFHVSNVIVVVPIVATWLWCDGRRALRPTAGFVLKAAALTAIPPLVHYRLWNPAQLEQWYLMSTNDTEFHDSGFFLLPSLQNLLDDSLLLFSEFLVPLSGGRIAVILGVSLTGLFLAVLVHGLWGLWGLGNRPARGENEDKSNLQITLGLATFATWAFFFSVAAAGYLFHWEIAFFGLWLLLAAGFASRPGQSRQARAAGVALVVLALAVPSFNLSQKYWAISRDDYNRDAAAATRIGGMMPPSEPLFLLGGGAGDNNLKAYMVHFGDRGWIAADVSMIEVQPEHRCQAFAGQIRDRLQQRGVAFLSTSVLDGETLAATAAHLGCADAASMIPLEEMSCTLLDPTPGVGLILGVSGNRAAIAALGDYFRSGGRADLAGILEDPQAFGPCRLGT